MWPTLLPYGFQFGPQVKTMIKGRLNLAIKVQHDFRRIAKNPYTMQYLAEVTSGTMCAVGHATLTADRDCLSTSSHFGVH